MARIIMVSGKGGVGKTTVALATGLACANLGRRTLVLSFDLAHSLRDSLDLDESLFGQHDGEPVNAAPNLDIQEIDVQAELQREWHGFYQYSASLMMDGGLSGVLAEEIAMMPGLDDVVALIRLNAHLADKIYDVIVLDSPPTGEALRFVGITSSLEWYVRKRLRMDRRISSIMRPMSKLANINMYLPDDNYFGAIHKLFERLEGIESTLRNPKITTVRLVTNPEKMVVRETQRAFMYFSMYGMTTDLIIINRLLPTSESYFREWAASQASFAEYIEKYFDPVLVTKMPLLRSEVVGLSHLQQFCNLLYDGKDPSSFFADGPAYGYSKDSSGVYRLTIALPFAERDQIDIRRHGADLTVRVGAFKRNILLPRPIIPLPTAGAKMQDKTLVVEFRPTNVKGVKTVTEGLTDETRG